MRDALPWSGCPLLGLRLGRSRDRSCSAPSASPVRRFGPVFRCRRRRRPRPVPVLTFVVAMPYLAARRPARSLPPGVLPSPLRPGLPLVPRRDSVWPSPWCRRPAAASTSRRLRRVSLRPVRGHDPTFRQSSAVTACFPFPLPSPRHSPGVASASPSRRPVCPPHLPASSRSAALPAPSPRLLVCRLCAFPPSRSVACLRHAEVLRAVPDPPFRSDRCGSGVAVPTAPSAPRDRAAWRAFHRRGASPFGPLLSLSDEHRHVHRHGVPPVALPVVPARPSVHCDRSARPAASRVADDVHARSDPATVTPRRARSARPFGGRRVVPRRAAPRPPGIAGPARRRAAAPATLRASSVPPRAPSFEPRQCSRGPGLGRHCEVPVGGGQCLRRRRTCDRSGSRSPPPRPSSVVASAPLPVVLLHRSLSPLETPAGGLRFRSIRTPPPPTLARLPHALDPAFRPATCAPAPASRTRPRARTPRPPPRPSR